MSMLTFNVNRGGRNLSAGETIGQRRTSPDQGVGGLSESVHTAAMLPDGTVQVALL